MYTHKNIDFDNTWNYDHNVRDDRGIDRTFELKQVVTPGLLGLNLLECDCCSSALMNGFYNLTIGLFIDFALSASSRSVFEDYL